MEFCAGILELGILEFLQSQKKTKQENGIFTILKRGQCCYIFFAAAAHERASGVFSIFFTYASACGDKKRICLCAYDFFAAFYAGG